MSDPNGVVVCAEFLNFDLKNFWQILGSFDVEKFSKNSLDRSSEIWYTELHQWDQTWMCRGVKYSCHFLRKEAKKCEKNKENAKKKFNLLAVNNLI